MSNFKVRALEIHSQYAWDFEWVKRTIEFMHNYNMTTLVLHRNDFIDRIIYPGKYFGGNNEKYSNIYEIYKDIFRTLYKYTPTRRSGPYHRRVYLKRVLEEAQRAGLNVYIANKELNFPEIILEFHPSLVKNGKICACDPFWTEFIKNKYREFYQEFPEISGLITSPGTRESMVSISSNRCNCEECRNTTPREWYKNLIMAIYEPTKEAGKQLVIRDFAFDFKNHSEVAAAIKELPDDICVSLKKTPHDYYPTFPNNPLIGKVGCHEQWIEFDVWGQYFGWGVAPSIIIDDIKSRMKFAISKGVKGVIFRTDWESLDGHSVFHTINLINLLGGIAFAKNLETTNDKIYYEWLNRNNYINKTLDEEKKAKTVKMIEDNLGQTWEVMSKTIFVNDCVFSDSSLLPVSMEHAYWLAEEKNSLKEWDASKKDALRMDETNLNKILNEKDEALELAQALYQKFILNHEGFTQEGYEVVKESLEILIQYVRAFRLATHSIVLTKYFIETDGKIENANSKKMLKHLATSLNDMISLAEEFKKLYQNTSKQHTVYMLLDYERLITLHNDLCQQLRGIGLWENLK